MGNKQSFKKKFIKFLVLILIGFIFMHIVFNQFLKKESDDILNIITPLASSIPPINQILNKNLQKNNSLKDAVEYALADKQGVYGIAIKNLKTGETFYSNEHKVFESGSLYKIWIMTTVYDQIQNKTLKEDEVLSEEIAVLNMEFNIPTESAELTDGIITIPVGNAIEQMITISHNYAALLLTKKIKLSNVVVFLKQNGFTESKVGIDGRYPNSTPSDIALFFEKLYKGELANKENTEKMIDLLKKQQLNDKLPKYLPQDAVVAHKTGEIGWFSHDAGIVYSPSGDYVIVVLSESQFPSGAEDRIAQVSKAVYEYFMRGDGNNE